MTWNINPSKPSVSVDTAKTGHSAPLPTSATTVDDFEDTGLSEYSGDTVDCATQTGVVQNGSRALEAANSKNGTTIYSTSGDGLNAYPSQGDTFRCWMRHTEGTSGVAIFGFGTSDSNNTYEIRHSISDSEYEIRKSVDGVETTLASANFNFSANTWYESEVSWASDGTIDATLYDVSGTEQANPTATDTTHSAEGVYFQHYNGNNWMTTYWDYYRIL